MKDVGFKDELYKKSVSSLGSLIVNSSPSASQSGSSPWIDNYDSVSSLAANGTIFTIPSLVKKQLQ